MDGVAGPCWNNLRTMTQMKTTLLRRLVFVLALVGSFQSAVGQVNVFGGFSFLNADSPSGVGRDSFSGWQASATGYVLPNLGLVADFGGHYKSYPVLGAPTIDLSSFEYLFGPQVRVRASRFSPFGHFLAGGLRQHSHGGGFIDMSENSLLLGVGGGLDVDVTKHLAIRIVQFDWLPAHIQGTWQNDAIRVGFGVVLRSAK